MESTFNDQPSTLQAPINMMTEDQMKALDAAGRQLRRGVLELCVLSAIAAEEEIYSSTIQEKLKDTPLEVKEGTLYPLLTRLKNSKLLDKIPQVHLLFLLRTSWKVGRGSLPTASPMRSLQGNMLASGLVALPISTQCWSRMLKP